MMNRVKKISREDQRPLKNERFAKVSTSKHISMESLST